MKIIIVALLLASVLFYGCKENVIIKETETPGKQPEMYYTDLSGKTLHEAFRAVHIDMDGDGNTDIHVKTEPTAETSSQLYRLKYAVSTNTGNFLLIDDNQQIPPLGVKDLITLENTNSHSWLDIVSISLADKVINSSGLSYWEGNWKLSGRRYLPVMLVRKNKKYLGWIELSINTETETLELFRSAISKEPDCEIKAGLY